MNSHLVLVAVLCLAAQFAHGQSGAIPPALSAAQLAQQRKDASAETLLQGVITMPTAILDGAVILQQQVNKSGVGSLMDASKKAGPIVSGTVSGVKILGATVQDGVEGFKREASQFAIEKGVESGAQAAAAYFTGQAVASGLALGTATGVAGLSYAAGSLFGTWARGNTDLGRSIGRFSDDLAFEYAPDDFKEWASGGTKQVNVNDPAVLQQMSDAAARNRRMRAFESVQRENAEQQRQIDASRVVLSGELSAQPAATAAPYDPTATLTMQALLSAAQANRPTRQLTTPVDGRASGGSCSKLDPATGCHPGHDEKAHPGGCKKC